jgi:hypothetical protein
MSQQAYILRNKDGTYVTVSNGGQAIHITPFETIDDVAHYIVNTQRIPIRDMPPYLNGQNAGFRPVSDYDFEVLKTLVTQEDADEITDKGASARFLSSIGDRIPALMSILRIGK